MLRSAQKEKKTRNFFYIAYATATMRIQQPVPTSLQN